MKHRRRQSLRTHKRFIIRSKWQLLLWSSYHTHTSASFQHTPL